MRHKFGIKSSNIIFIVFIILFVMYTYNFNKTHAYSSSENSQASVAASYAKAKVTAVNNDAVVENGDYYYEGAHRGEQIVELVITDGKYKGRIVETKNYLITTNYMFLKKNDRVTVQVGEDQLKDDVYFNIYQYDRTGIIFLMIAVFMLLIVLVGKWKGVKTILALIFSIYMIIYFTLPLIYHGKSPVMISILTVVCITLVTLYLLNGWNQKTKAAAISTALGLVSAGVIYTIFSVMLHITGYSTGSASEILLIQGTFGMQIKDILFATILIASLGAVMDVGMSISSALLEMVEIKPDITKRQLFVSGMNIGQDMIGTMTNTLILAFVGTSFISMIIIALSGTSIKRILNSNFLSIELLQGLSGTMAIVLTVPIASLICASLYVRRDKSHSETDSGETFSDESRTLE